MASLNKVFLAGNLTRDPEVRYLPSGMAVAEMGLAVNERYKDSTTDEWKEKAVFVDLVAWGRQAETVKDYLSKGSGILVEGRLQLDQWETKQGEKRSRLRVNVSRLQMLDSKRTASATAGKVQPDTNSAGAEQAAGDVDNEEDLPF